MSGDVDLYRPVEDDWAKARALRLQALRDAPRAFIETLAGAEARDEAGWRARIRPSATGRYLVARDADDTWVAAMTVYTAEDRVWLVGVWVHPDHRGTGLAERMLRAQLEYVRTTLGAARLWLHVGGDNPRARRLYERVGFRATGEVEHFAGHDVEEHVLVADLDG